jgi:antirestriction protein ArdC
MNNATYQTVTDRIVAMLEAGARPWAKSWTNDAGEITFSPMQRPLRVTGAPYTGINVINLWSAAQMRGFTSRYWMTFKGAKELGASVRKGAKAELAFYVGKHTVTDTIDGEDKEREISFLRAYCVFNADEIDGLPAKYAGAVAAPVANPWNDERDAVADSFVAHTGAQIAHGGDRAFYSPSTDSIRMPAFRQFRDGASYYATLLHELAHWTSHATRCARELGKRFGDDAYAAEELVAELSAAFLCADLAITAEPREDHASYLASWLRVLKADNRAIFKAAALADRAAGFLHRLQPGDAPDAPAPAPVPVAEPVAAPAAPVAPVPIAAEPVAAAAAKGRPARAKRPQTPAKPGKPGNGASVVAMPARIKDYDTFIAARRVACQAACDVHGLRWALAEGASVWARVPAAWVACRVFGRVSRSPRDQRMPAAQFWPAGRLPVGPQYAAEQPRETGPIAYPTGITTNGPSEAWRKAHLRRLPAPAPQLPLAA